MLEHLDYYFSIFVTFIAGVSTILLFWNQWVYKPAQKRKEEIAAKRTQEMIEAYQKFSEPSQEMLAQVHNRATKLEEIAEQNTEILSKHEALLDNHNERLIVLETRSGLKYIKEEK